MNTTSLRNLLFLLLVGVGLFAAPQARATITIEFTLGDIDGLPPGCVGILVADRDGNGFGPIGGLTKLEEGQTIKGTDDVIVGVVQASQGSKWNGNTGFYDVIRRINYRRLGIEEGDALIFYWFPGITTPGASVGGGDLWQSFRTDDIGVASGGDIAYVAPVDPGTYTLANISTALGGDLDSSDLSGSGDVDAGTSAGTTDGDGNVIRDLETPPDLSSTPGEQDALYDPNDPVFAGNYFGLARTDDPADTGDDVNLVGSASGKISHSGKLGTGIASLTLILDGAKYGLKGPVDAGTGDFVVDFPKKDGTATLTFDGQLVDNPSGDGRKLVGTITGDGNTVFVDLLQRVFHPKNNPADFAGAKTLALPADPEAPNYADQPGGDGVGTGTMGTNGIMKTALVLGDGTKATAVVFLSADLEMMFFRTLYRGASAGHIGGVFTGRDVENTSTADGELHWVKNGPNTREKIYQNGFDLQQPVVVSDYRAPFGKSGERVISEFADIDENVVVNIRGGGAIAPVMPKLVTWDARNRISTINTPEEVLKVAVNKKSGLVTGLHLFKNPRQVIKFTGVAMQNQGLIVGNFVGDGESGRVLMDSAVHPELEVTEASSGDPVSDSDTLDFGTINTDGEISEIGLRLRNVGTGRLFLSELPAVDSPNGGFFLSSSRKGYIPPGGETVIRVRFNPSQVGQELGSLVIASNDENASPFTLTLDGTGDGASGGTGPELLGPAQDIQTPVDLLDTPDSSAVGAYDMANAPGNYYGLLIRRGAASDPAGFISLKVSHNTKLNTGLVSGSLFADGLKFGIKGALDEFGELAAVLTRKGGITRDFTLAMHEDSGNQDSMIVGTLTDPETGEVFDYVALLNPWHPRNMPFGTENKQYSILIPHIDNLGVGYPGGACAGTMSVATSGVAKLLIFLADGNKLSWSGKVSSGSQLGVYVAMDKAQPLPGVVSGLLSFRNEPGVSDLDGEFLWRRSMDPKSSVYSNGFETRRTVIGCEYVKPAKGEFALTQLGENDLNAFVALTGFGVNEAWDVTWTTANKINYTPEGSEILRNNIGIGNGLVNGLWFDRGGTNQKYLFRGVVYQKQGIAAGYWYFKDGQTGLYELIPHVVIP